MASSGERPPRPPRDIVPLLVLVAILVIALGGWLLFPAVQRELSTQDCIASGHNNCGRLGGQ